MTELYEIVVNAMNTVEHINGDKKRQAIHIIDLCIDKMPVSEGYKHDVKKMVPFMIEMVVWTSKHPKDIKINVQKCASKFSCVKI